MHRPGASAHVGSSPLPYIFGLTATRGPDILAPTMNLIVVFILGWIAIVLVVGAVVIASIVASDRTRPALAQSPAPDFGEVRNLLMFIYKDDS